MGMSKMTVTEFTKWAAERNIELVSERGGFKVGEIVTFNNDFGVSFENNQIIGISKETTSWGACVYLNHDSYWHPVKLSSISRGLAVKSEPKTITVGTLELTEAGFDWWCRKLWQDKNGRTFVDVDGVPHTMTSEGEPIAPLKQKA